MAQAKAKTETVTTVTGVTLTLTLEEAQALHGLAGKVCGTSQARTLTDNVYNALSQTLSDADVDTATWRANHPYRVTSDGNGVTFPNSPRNEW